MEVNRVSKTGVNKIAKKESIPAESVSFTEVMGKKREEVLYAKMTKMMQNIQDQGKILSTSQTVEDLKRYKKLVKEFMDDAVNNGLKLEEQRGFNRRGRTKVYKIVKEVDSKLIDLTNTVSIKKRTD